MLGLEKKVSEIKNKHFYPALSKLSGNVLEIGFGNAENLSHYPSDCRVFALEKSEKKICKAEQKIGKYRNIKFIKGIAEALLFPDDFFDAVVVSFVLCSVHSVEKAVREIKRVLKPKGKFVMLEHIRSGNKVVGRLQDVGSSLWSWIFGCHLNSNPMHVILRNGFNLLKEDFSATILTPYIFVALCKDS